MHEDDMASGPSINFVRDTANTPSHPSAGIREMASMPAMREPTLRAGGRALQCSISPVTPTLRPC
ncbi:hypothetical protein BDV28DRAFT_130700 [Aspergillus coremiiformis]|uniref:Uncharacterized protein n=1 Tax=Aspergillus coremiiformis TaxID=138285 RepID=A0A5N6ZA38_9EURO|nr:hypothetical protein BDV28DRAFT_130700 [Aspergillus coremiiformis]